MGINSKVIVRRPTHLGRKPRTAAALLRQTHTFLTEEGKWIRGSMFQDGDAKQAYEEGFCGNWGVCSVGAIGIVSGEFKPAVVEETSRFAFNGDFFEDYYWTDDYDPQDSVVFEACAYLALAIDPKSVAFALWDDPYHCESDWVETVISWNDQQKQTRTKVLKTFAEAAELAARPGSFDTVARKHLASLGINEEDFD